MEEYWKDIKGFEGYYQISNYGRVKSLEREAWNGRGNRLIKEKILIPNSNSNPNSIIDNWKLYKEGITQNYNTTYLLITSFYTTPSNLKYSIDFFDLYLIDPQKDYIVENLYLDFNRFAIRVFDYEGHWLKDYSSADIFLKDIDYKHLNTTSLYQVAKGNILSTLSFQSRYLRTDRPLTPIHIKKLPSLINKSINICPIAKYFDKKLICVYNSLTEAAENNLLIVEKICNSLDRNSSINGFTFKRIQ